MKVASGTRLGPYEILGPIGAGGMGEVYRARDTRLGREVAVKVLPSRFAQDPDRLRRFEQEARAAGALNHPNIVAIHDVGSHEGFPYVVSELLEGGTLRERMAGSSLPPHKAIEYAVQAALGLAAAHEKGIVHRDLKPENLFVTKDGHVKILDFGLAKLTHDGEKTGTDIQTRTAATQAGTILGTVGYMSPEQVQGRRTDHQSDIFSFGAILYEMLSGKRAFEGPSQVETMNAILREEPPDFEEAQRNLAPGLERIVKHCLEKRPEERFQSARDLAFDLQSLSGASGPASAAAVVHPARPRGEWLAWGVALLAVLAALSLAIPYFRAQQPQTRPVRFLITPPEGTSLAGSIAVSPDGRQLAFVAATPDGSSSLRVRRLDSLEARALPGTEGALHPFWSPDSRFLGFFAQGKLQKIRVDGGPPQTLCQIFDARGGTWSSRGVILFSPNVGDRLYRIADTGGAVAPVTKLDHSRQESSHQWPHFLPDGSHFLYLVWGAQAEARGIYVASLDSEKTERVMATDWGAAYAQRPGGGELLFLRGRTLMAQAFDPEALRLGGEPSPVAEDVWYDETAPGLASFSVSKQGVLAYRSGGIRTTQLVWLDRSGKALESVGLAGAYRDPELSPDERRIAASRIDPQTGTLDVWLFEWSRSLASRFTFHPANEGTPLWSPDGSRIVFSSDRDGPPSLYQKVSTGAGSEETLLASSVSNYPTGWSRDSRFIVYAGWDPKTSWDLWVLPMSGDRKPMLYARDEFDEFQARFSPDGRWIAYSSNESNRYEVYVRPFPVAGGKWQVSTNGGSQPSWNRNGKELFYLAPDRRLMSVEVRAAETFEAGVPKALFQTQVTGLVDARNHYAVAGDGQRFLLNSIVQESASSPITVALDWTARP